MHVRHVIVVDTVWRKNADNVSSPYILQQATISVSLLYSEINIWYDIYLAIHVFAYLRIVKEQQGV